MLKMVSPTHGLRSLFRSLPRRLRSSFCAHYYYCHHFFAADSTTPSSPLLLLSSLPDRSAALRPCCLSSQAPPPLFALHWLTPQTRVCLQSPTVALHRPRVAWTRFRSASNTPSYDRRSIPLVRWCRTARNGLCTRRCPPRNPPRQPLLRRLPPSTAPSLITQTV